MIARIDERNGWTTCSRAKTSCPRDALGFLVAGDFRSRNVTCHAEADSNGTRFTVQIPEQVLELEFEVNTYLDARSLLGNDQAIVSLKTALPPQLFPSKHSILNLNNFLCLFKRKLKNILNLFSKNCIEDCVIFRTTQILRFSVQKCRID